MCFMKSAYYESVKLKIKTQAHLCYYACLMYIVIGIVCSFICRRCLFRLEIPESKDDIIK